MSLEQAAKHLAAHGRGSDTELVHMTKGEVNSLRRLAKQHGGTLTINPHTGLPEAGFLKSLLPMVIGAGVTAATGGAAAPWMIGLGLGGLETARTGSLQKGLMAGLGAYGGAGIAGGLMAAGTSAAQNTAMQGAKTSAEKALADQATSNAAAELAGNQTAAESARLAAQSQTVQQAQAQAAAEASKQALASPVSTMSSGIGSLGTEAGRNAFGNYATGMGSSVSKLGLAAAAPVVGGMMEPQKQPEVKTDSAMPQRLQYDVGRPTDAQGQAVTPAPDVPQYGELGKDFGRERNYFPNAGYRNITPEQAKSLRGYADGGEVQFPYQEPVVRMADGGTPDINDMTGEQNEFARGGLNLSGEYSRDLTGDLDNTYEKAERKGDKETMRAVKSETTLRDRLRNPKMYATGGLSAAASHLGDYSDGGRLLKGPGDGVSDSIPATIGNKRPARLADGEFVVPARIVSELGNGSTEAGARKLYAMLDRVQAARKKSIGKGKVAKNSRADKFLPA